MNGRKCKATDSDMNTEKQNALTGSTYCMNVTVPGTRQMQNGYVALFQTYCLAGTTNYLVKAIENVLGVLCE